MITFRQGDLFASGLPALAHGCNCHGMMSAGIAAGFRQRWPDMYAAYRLLCSRGQLRPGYTMRWDNLPDGPVIWNLMTQHRPGRDASVPAIWMALDNMVAEAQEIGITEIGLPWIGCGIGGLARDDVRPVLERHADSPVTLIVYQYDPWSPS
jgi:O-acetyl-ADP-ribose deacetylase (regulator of RNase III)